MPDRVSFDIAGLNVRVTPEKDDAARIEIVPVVNDELRGTPSEAEPLVMDGEGEYRLDLDPVSGVGTVLLCGQHRQAALANALRRVLRTMIRQTGGIVLHSACVVRNNRAFLFAGKSGAGKSTVCSLSPDARVLSDDMIALREKDGRWMAWGMPAVRDPDLHVSAAGPFPVQGIFMLRKSKYVRAEPVRASRAAAVLLTFCPDMVASSEAPGNALEMLGRLTGSVPCFDLYFDKTPSFWETVGKVI